MRTFWAIAHSDGTIAPYTLAYTKTAAIAERVRDTGWKWKQLHRLGARAIRVRVLPIGAPPRASDAAGDGGV